MTEIIISKSKNKDKKYDARIDGKKTVSFGAAGMSDFTKHKDTERKQRYLNRHKKKMKIGMIIQLLDFSQKIFFGISQQ